ncbi:glycosyltransferase [Altererythrobacter indicus]|uniref:Glycosyltransferase n=1 Tax=Altericroceibacterium indicum TaxID=374177 RepID=A0A845AB84_9SPHN|nr:glycosyltransferase family 4 protein [Altericroceibacterium indicum]MXP26629.1 glycosyltransferase [Altericroceibacterium indicum]
MIVLSHPTGALHARILAEALSDSGMLKRFYTSLNLSPLEPLIRHLPQGLAREAHRRSFVLPSERVRMILRREIAALLAERLPLIRRFHLAASYRRSGMNRMFDRKMAKALEREPRAAGFYGYIDSSRHSLEAASRAGLTSFVEVTTCFRAFDEALWAQERRIQPDWAATLPPSRTASGPFGEEEQARMLDMADRIIVPSHYVARSLPGHCDGKIIRFPYGISRIAPAISPVPRNGPLRILFAGALTQRKGISYLADAMARLGGGGKLTVIGRKVVEGCPAVERLIAGSQWHPSLPNTQVRAMMAEHDVLVLPSLSDAFGLVVMEALSQGTPVIVSDNVGAGELLSHGREGFIVPTRDSDRLAEALMQLHMDRDLLEEMSLAALARARALQESDTAAHFVETLKAVLQS